MARRDAIVNQEALEQLQGKVLNDVAGALGLLTAYTGDRLNLYSALRELGDASSAELAKNTGLDERYVREWLSTNAAAGYVSYRNDTEKFSLSPEQALVFASEGHPACMQGFFEAVMSVYRDQPKTSEIFRTGAGLAWGDHDESLYSGTERFFRPIYTASLVDEWLPALDG